MTTSESGYAIVKFMFQCLKKLSPFGDPKDANGKIPSENCFNASRSFHPLVTPKFPEPFRRRGSLFQCLKKLSPFGDPVSQIPRKQRAENTVSANRRFSPRFLTVREQKTPSAKCVEQAAHMRPSLFPLSSPVFQRFRG